MKGSSNRSAFAWKALNSSCTKEQGEQREDGLAYILVDFVRFLYPLAASVASQLRR